MKIENDTEKDFILHLVTNGDVGYFLGDFITKGYSSKDVENLRAWFLVEAILFGGLGQVCKRAFEFDSMLTQMFRERTHFFLEKIAPEGLKKPKKLLTNRLNLMGGKKVIPQILRRYSEGKRISFSNQILDMKVSVAELQELIKEYFWLSRDLQR
ncbi:MAG: hypothetical protein ACW98I_20850 [Candidatus Hodarchaeales archaeon]